MCLVLERGTLQPDTLCDVNYNGRSSSSRGKLKHPGTEQIFWNVEGQLRCSQNLIPATNQSISIKVILVLYYPYFKKYYSQLMNKRKLIYAK